MAKRKRAASLTQGPTSSPLSKPSVTLRPRAKPNLRTKPAIGEAVVTKEPPADLKDGAPPGFEIWKTTTKLASGKKFVESEYNAVAAQYTQLVEVNQKESFILKPLTFISEGPLKGRHVLLLAPAIEPFRFMDLPPELRKMISEVLLMELGDVRIGTYKPSKRPKRAVRKAFHAHNCHAGLKFSSANGKWIGSPPSAYALLRVSKQCLQEAAPIAYGANKFSFDSLSDTLLFLDTIGDMRKHLKHIIIGVIYQVSKYQAVYHKLKDAKELRTIEIPHNSVCLAEGDPYPKAPSRQGLVAHCKPLLQVLHKAYKGGERNSDVLDIIKIREGDKCYSHRNGDECPGSLACVVPCKDLRSHCTQLTADIRKLVVEELGIEG